MRRRKRQEIYAAQLKVLFLISPLAATIALMHSIFH